MSSPLGMCETPGCMTDASLQCPTCLKIGIQGSYFCSQVSRHFRLYVEFNLFKNLYPGEIYMF